jgi:hypothetical protein
MHLSPLLLLTDPLLPIRILAIVALIAVISVFVYVGHHLRKIDRIIIADDLVPVGTRNNMPFAQSHRHHSAADLSKFCTPECARGGIGSPIPSMFFEGRNGTVFNRKTEY